MIANREKCSNVTSLTNFQQVHDLILPSNCHLLSHTNKPLLSFSSTPSASYIYTNTQLSSINYSPPLYASLPPCPVAYLKLDTIIEFVHIPFSWWWSACGLCGGQRSHTRVWNEISLGFGLLIHVVGCEMIIQHQIDHKYVYFCSVPK